MFADEDLKNYLEVNNTISLESFIVGEWNLNDLEKISNYGNYRYRPFGASVQYTTIPNIYDANDTGDYYLDNLESNTFSSYVLDNSGQEILFTSLEKDRELYFSLKECFQPFRPRSGINKALWIDGKYIDGIKSGLRPRYYMASRSDQFKYWTSYKKDYGIERGISSTSEQEEDIGYDIEDAVPFVIYKELLPTNRIVVKLQTNLADGDEVTIRTQDGRSIVDPLTDRDSSSIPKRWSIDYLNENNQWVEAAAFDENSLKLDGTNIVDWDGYVELYYGIVVPEEYRNSFNLVASLNSSAQFVDGSLIGESYLVGATEASKGTLYIWNGSDWDTMDAEYGFSLCETDDTKRLGIVKNIVDPEYYIDNSNVIYREFAFIKGLRLKVDTLYGPKNTFDLIELSPRLKVDFSKYVGGFDFNKSLAMVDTSLPVGGLVASNGNLVLMNHDGAFSRNNTYNSDTKIGSIVANILKPNIKFDIYESVLNVNGYDKFIPLKTLYAEEFPNQTQAINDISVPLRDNFFRLETVTAPSLFLKNITLTAAVAILLDNIGFSNYVFKNLDTSNDPVISYFFVEPNITVAEVLQRLAVATQTAMFFDEFNNFVVMSKEYLLPEELERDTDLVLYGQKTDNKQPNIVQISAMENKIINDGQIDYITRYIQRSPASLNQALNIDNDRTYIYKPVLLWEVAGQEETKTINESTKQVGYALGAVALNTSLNASAPYVENNQIVNNIIDLGEDIYWLPRFQGYLYANGEIIKYDAVEYTIPGQGTLWISSNQEYQKYFANLPFNGKIYPTGNIRIYTEPFYEEINNTVIYKNGEVKSHGRRQFGTTITSHNAGLSDYWLDNDNVGGAIVDAKYIFNTSPSAIYYLGQDLGQRIGDFITPDEVTASTYFTKGTISRTGVINIPLLSPGEETYEFKNEFKGNFYAKKSFRNGIIANFMRQTIPNDDLVKEYRTTSAGTIQSSALVFSGPNPMPTNITSKNFMSYVYKNFNSNSDYRHFGTRMRIIGKQESNGKVSNPTNASEYFTIPTSGNESVTINGGSGGIGIMINPETNRGYYFEICSLTSDNLKQYNKVDPTTNEPTSVLHNLIFYKLVPGFSSKKIYEEVGPFQPAFEAIPYKLWGSTTQILVDEGKFVGVGRQATEQNPTVYDLAVEYEKIGNKIRFYLYLNNILIATVDDTNPLPIYNNMALFVRGSSKCMFENIYALKNLESKETGKPIIKDIAKAFGDDEITTSESLRKYAMSGLIQSTHLSGISSQNAPKYDIYFEEFGTIMRECAYFNIKYDQAYPAFLAFLAPTFNKEKTYTSSGFRAGSYGAEFLIFNSTDRAIKLDETSGNYLRIIGVAFTQNTSQTLSVDDYFKEVSNFSDPIITNNVIQSPEKADKVYDNIKHSRSKYGKRAFALSSVYIQNDDTANNLMNWLVNKSLRQRNYINLEIFGAPHIQLGDIVTIDYDLDSNNNQYKFVDTDKQFVVHSINYQRGYDGPIISVGVMEI